MSRLRWLLGGLLSLLALAAAGVALRTYVVHKLWLGGLAVIVLGVIAIAGFVSLARARLRLASELSALSADPPTGELFNERRRQLQSILAAAARPDLDALSQATSAAELGRAYLGKYLVAVTVLVGLVGTFAGLMETLRGVAPLLADEQMTTLRALAAPLAGLDVTFGASLVGILVTLSLALVQGDLALAEEATLARLEERTRHVLLPALWPPADAADERAARELAALRGELASFVIRTSEAAGERVASVAKVEVDRMVQAVRAVVEASVQDTAQRVETGLLSLAGQVEAKLTPVLAAQQQQLTSLQQSAERASAQAVTAGSQAAASITNATAQTLDGVRAAMRDLSDAQQSLLADTRSVITELASAAQTSSAQLDSALHTLGEKQGAVATQLLKVHVAECERLSRSLSALGEQQAATSTQLLSAHATECQRLDATLHALGEKQMAASTTLLSAQAAESQRIDATLLALAEKQAGTSAQLLSAQAAECDRWAKTADHVVQRTEQALRTLSERQVAHATELQTQQQTAIARNEQALQAVHESHSAQLGETANALCRSIESSVGGEGLRLAQAAQAMQQAAGELQAAAQAVGEPLSALTPELHALSREVALLASQHEGETPSATLGEILRLGEGLERLEALLHLSAGPAEHREPAVVPPSLKKPDQAA